jgi:nanoRNase/pAp phosphatase (c-di-AMP/oligoRNAs hydrolase)
VVYEYYGADKFPAACGDFVKAVDKVDSANLTVEEINTPTGWTLLGFIMDPRSGLGRYRNYRVSNYQLMLDMIEYCRTMTAQEILEIDDVKERVDRYFGDGEDFARMLRSNAEVHGDAVVLDLRNQEPIYCGNRFMVYTLFPECSVSVRVIWGFKKQNVVLTVGHSILNRTSKVDVGALMFSLGGGGHRAVGTCQVPEAEVPETLEKILARINAA